MRASLISALAISTICCWPMPSSETGRSGSMSSPTSASAALRLLAHHVPVDEPGARGLAAEQQVLRHRQRGHESQLLRDEGDAVLLGVAQPAEGRDLSVQQDLAAVGARRVVAAEHLDQRATCRRRSPRRARAPRPARRSNDTPSSALTPGKCLVIDRSSSSAIGRGKAPATLLDFLVDVLARVVPVLDDGRVDVRLVHRDRLQEDARHVLLAVVHRPRGLGDRFLLGQLHREVGGLGGERLDRLVDGHGLAAGHDALAGGEVGVLAGDQHLAEQLLLAQRLHARRLRCRRSTPPRRPPGCGCGSARSP